jgi:hypothetical protein
MAGWPGTHALVREAARPPAYPTPIEEAGMSDKGPGTPSTDDEGFALWEGWMYGAMLFAPAVEHIARFPPANDNDGED